LLGRYLTQTSDLTPARLASSAVPSYHFQAPHLLNP
jgi:hypothetical protein